MDSKHATSAERTGNPVKNAELRTAELNQVKMSPLIGRDLERAVEVKDLSRSDLDEEMIELNYLKERLRLHTFAQELTSIAAEVERTKLEEEERRREELSHSVTHDMEKCLEENSNLVVELVRNMEEMMCQKENKIELLNAENKAFASKIFALEEKGKEREELLKEKGDLVLKLVRELEEVKSRKEKELELLIAENKTLASKISKKEIGDRLRDEVLDEPRKENWTLVAGSEEIEKDLESALIDELVELKMQRSQLLANHDIACGMGSFTQLQIDELKSKMTKKNIGDKKRAKYEIQMSNLLGELAKHKSSKRKIGDAHRSCIKKCDIKAAEIASMHRELKMKADEAVVLRLQLNELVKDMEEMKGLKEKEVELLNAENKTLASKISKKEIGGRCRDEVLDDLRKESLTLVAGSEEIEKRDAMEEKNIESHLFDEVVELKIPRSQLLAKNLLRFRVKVYL
ncbi:hypothetical protein KSP40_PGU007838 [Platanthera guangdongensis]|uniref:Uncharacterized protein n=1 Tax=Platanthera guangdongensis TaxID=2320717 RepID=A0ABR2MX14_9ASPA